MRVLIYLALGAVAFLATPVFSAAVSGASVRQEDDGERGPPPDGEEGGGGGGPRFENASNQCLAPDDYVEINPTTNEGYMSCFQYTQNADGTATVLLNGIPNSVVSATNPNDMCQTPLQITLPKPVKTTVNRRVPQMGAIAVALDGVYIFGALEGNMGNAVVGGGGLSVLCDGHAQPEGIWHYHHPFMACKEAATDELVGWALDGFPIYGAIAGSKDDADAVLDDCNGRDFDDSFGYRYHVRTRDQVDETTADNDGPNNTDNWKYVLGCYRGEDSVSERDAVTVDTSVTCIDSENTQVIGASAIVDEPAAIVDEPAATAVTDVTEPESEGGCGNGPHKLGETCIGAEGYATVEWCGCEEGYECTGPAGEGGYGRTCAPVGDQCYGVGERCQGEPLFPYVPYQMGCCEEGSECVDDNAEYGKQCSDPASADGAATAPGTGAPERDRPPRRGEEEDGDVNRLTDGPENSGVSGPFSNADSNRDGTVTREEIEAFMDVGPERRVGLLAFFDEKDTNGDGIIDEGELAVVEPAFAFDGTDSNEDGLVSRDEIVAYVNEDGRSYRKGLGDFFVLIDTDGNDEVSPEEIQAAHDSGLLAYG